ncbi:MAG: hypothetical protein NTV86_23000, partial [Planctomycetota bacterium]|nr:hypothetical protein [Planctomycetota bacterium]
AILALAVLDLPFEAPKHESRFDEAAFTLTPAAALIVFHKEIKETPLATDKTILVNQNYFRQDDRYRHVNNEQLDKFVTDEFLVQTVYGCQVVVTNTTSSRQKLDVLLQIPRGAIPVLNGQETRGLHVQLDPFSTQKIEYYFYFPLPGAFEHYGVHVAREGKLIAATEAGKLNAVTAFSKVDMTSWDWVSQNGTTEQVMEFLKGANLGRVDLERIAWRMGDKAVFAAVTGLLAERHVFHNVLWSYALKHDAPAAAREFLKHQDRRATGVPAHGVLAPRQRPRPPPGGQEAYLQRRVRRAVRAADGGPLLPPRVGQRRPDGPGVLPAAAGPRGGGRGVLRRRRAGQTPHRPPVRLRQGIPGVLPGGRQDRPRDRRRV